MNKKIILGLFIGLFAFWGQAVFAAITPGEIMFNEVYTNPSSGQEWYEIINKTSSPIDLSNVVINRSATGDSMGLSGTLPAGGLMVFSINSNAGNDAGDTITLEDNSTNPSTIIHGVSYGTFDLTNTINAPGIDQSVIRVDDNVYAVGAHTKGWFNDAVTWTCSQLQGNSSPNAPPLLSSIDGCLQDQAIISSFGSIDDPTSALNIAFERRSDITDANTIIGKILFSGPLNLTGNETLNYLKLLPGKIHISEDNLNDAYVRVGLNTVGTNSVLHNSTAIVTMYGLTSSTLPNPPEIIVKRDDNTVINSSDDDYPIISNRNYDAGTGVFSFEINHFSYFIMVQEFCTVFD